MVWTKLVFGFQVLPTCFPNEHLDILHNSHNNDYDKMVGKENETMKKWLAIKDMVRPLDTEAEIQFEFMNKTCPCFNNGMIKKVIDFCCGNTIPHKHLCYSCNSTIVVFLHISLSAPTASCQLAQTLHNLKSSWICHHHHTNNKSLNKLWWSTKHFWISNILET